LADRDDVRGAFLARAGWDGARLVPLAGDASFRRYFRLLANGSRAILMDAPPERERVGPFVDIARHLARLGLSAPEIHAADLDAGFLLIEDFGDDTFSRLLRAGADETALYALAVDVLVRLHRLPPRDVCPPELEPYDGDRLVNEALLLPQWYLPAVRDRPLRQEEAAAWVAAWRAVLGPVLDAPPTLVLRDFHVDNLMRLPGRHGPRACGLLDFQDAVAGHPAYDLMSLLEDARRDVAPEVGRRMRARYAAGVGAAACSGEAFERAFTILAAQRHAKVIGIFTRLWRRDGKPVYLPHIPRVWRLLGAALKHPALAPVARWVDTHLPPDCRRVPAP
jgi:aminoglycoside/choline kinase family phosphotransferase